MPWTRCVRHRSMRETSASQLLIQMLRCSISNAVARWPMQQKLVIDDYRESGKKRKEQRYGRRISRGRHREKEEEEEEEEEEGKEEEEAEEGEEDKKRCRRIWI